MLVVQNTGRSCDASQSNLERRWFCTICGAVKPVVLLLCVRAAGINLNVTSNPICTRYQRAVGVSDVSQRGQQTIRQAYNISVGLLDEHLPISRINS